MLLFLDRRENTIKINGDKYQETIDIFIIKGRYFLFLFLFLYNFYHFEKRQPNLKNVFEMIKKIHSNKRFLINQILVNFNLPLYDLEYAVFVYTVLAFLFVLRVHVPACQLGKILNYSYIQY